jgi:hypothetical protein
VFSQTHYDAVLLADGTFYQPLVVSATDADEPSSANSQVAYEIIAGNQNDLFAIDSLSGAIYPTGSAGGASPASPSRPIQMPSILSEPILPFISTRDQHNHNRQPDQHGKILPSPNAHGHEVEETTTPSGQPLLRLNWPRSVSPSGGDSASAASGEARLGRGRQSRQNVLPAADLLPVESGGGEPSSSSLFKRHHQTRAATPTGTTQTEPKQSQQQQPQTAQSQRGVRPNDRDIVQHLNQGNPGHQQQQHFDASKLPPVTTLVVRAHDFGIPLRSATCKVNIYNQALLSRSLSVILNGTAEQLEQRRELIERSFGALTGSRVQIESIDALSDSSSISVARLKLAIPAGHSLIDLTDLSALMTAVDYKPPPGSNCPTQQQQQNLEQFRHPIHYITTGDRIYPIHHAPISSNISSATGSAGGGGATATGTTPIFTDFQSFEHASNIIERKLLFYIIIVGICILALLVIWMIYFCCREDQQQQRQRQMKESGRTSGKWRQKGGHHHHQESVDGSEFSRDASTNAKSVLKERSQHKSKSSSRTHLMDEQQSMARSASQLNMGEQQDHNDGNKTQAKTTMSPSHPIGNQLLKQKQQQQQQLSIPSNIKPEHYSMYNGQVWFEQGGLVRPSNSGRLPAGRAAGQRGSPSAAALAERRASSAPSVGGHSLDSSLHAIIAAGGRSSAALSPTQESSLATPQLRGQFFPNTLGYAENLATIGAAPGAAYLYPSATGGAITGGGQRQLLGRRTLARSRGRVVPLTVLTNGGDGSNGFTNQAFDATDLEQHGNAAAAAAAGLVMVPLVGAGVAQARRGSHHSKEPHQHRHGGRKASSKSHHSTSASSASSSQSDSTRTLDEEDELDHESVVLDSDQELLGFDSTGTPIIATRTRHKADGEPDTSLLLSGGLAPAPVPTSSAISPSSPAATVIDMSQTTRPKESGAKTASDASKEEDHDSRAKPDAAGEAPSGQAEQIADGAGAKQEAVSEATSPLRSEQADGLVERGATTNGTEAATGAGQEDASPSDTNAKKRVDLMSELSERLSSANGRRPLRRQSADDDKRHGDSQQEQERRKQTDGQTTADSGSLLPQLVERAETAGEEQSAGDKNQPDKGPATGGKDASKTDTTTVDADTKRRQAFAKRSQTGESISCQSQSTISEATTTGEPDSRPLRDMNNAELLEKQSIFAMTYSGVATDKLPS